MPSSSRARDTDTDTDAQSRSKPARPPADPRRWLRLNGPAILAALFFCALATVLFAPVLGSSRFLTWDVPEQYWPDLQYLCGSLWEGHFPRWNPFDRGGYPFHADPQSGLYYPLNWGLCLVGGASPALGFAEFRAALHFALAGGFMCGFLRCLGLGWGAAITGGVAFMTAPYQRRMWEVNTSYTIAWLPALWWSLELLLQVPNGRRAGRLAIVAAVAVTVGSPPSLFHTAVGAGLYALVGLGRNRRVFAYLLLAGLLTLALSLQLLWPAYELMRHSVQEGTDYAAISRDSYEARELLGLFIPRNKYLYVGIPAILLAVWGALRGEDVPRPTRILFVLIAAYATVMTLGDHTPVYRALFHVMPGVSLFRAPVRYSALLGASVAALSGIGADYLPKSKYSSFVAAALVLASIWPALPPDRDAHAGPIPGAPARFAALQSRARDLGTDYRYYDEFAVGLRTGTRLRRRDFRGYQDPLQLERYSHLVGHLHEFPRVLEQFNVKYLLRGGHFLHGTEHHFLPAGAESSFADDRGGNLWETREPLPAAYWVPQGVVVPSGVDALWRLRRTAPARTAIFEADHENSDVALTREAPAERPITPAQAHASGAIVGSDDGEPDAPARFRAASRFVVTRDEVRVTIETPGAGWLVVNEAYYPGWSATVDDNEALVRRVNYLVRAVEIQTAGTHRIVMRYTGGKLPWLNGTAVVALLLSAFLATRREDDV